MTDAEPPPGWTKVADADLAPGSIVATQLGDTDLVAWRTASGIACVMDARCPHQWSHLAGEGAVDGEEIVCCSHGWRFAIDGSGSMGRASGGREPRAPIAVYPCLERRDGIWTTTPGISTPATPEPGT